MSNFKTMEGDFFLHPQNNLQKMFKKEKTGKNTIKVKNKEEGEKNAIPI